MAEAVAGGMQGAAAVASVVVEFDIEAVGECLPFCMSHMMQEEAGPGGLVAVVLYFALQAPLAIFDSPERRLAQSIHSFHDHDRWILDYVLVEAAETLTWAERGMPLNEHCRTPLWPNSDRERTSPGLTFLAVRRARCTNYRDDTLRIAWTWWNNVGPRSLSRSRKKPSTFLK
jgi:hypothetical protein